MLDPDCKYIKYDYISCYGNRPNENFDMPYLKSYAEQIESCRKHEKLVRAVAKYTSSFEKINPFYDESIDVIIHMKEFVN
jgi:GTP1/Obg family GTP-binding protein